MTVKTSDERLIRSQAVVARVVGGETLIVPVRSSVGDLASIYSFNATGSLIWNLLAEPRNLPELSAAVTEKYAVEPAQAERDVGTFIYEMKSLGLVEVETTVPIAAD
jgi:hypothetical protein